ncbi:MAG: NTP/NDP exchange transporter [Chlamydiota bacterium]
MSQTTSEFGKWRSRLWPVHNFELKKLLPMFFMFFLISFNYTILRDAKDAIIVTAKGSGAEAVPFLKLYGTLPCAILFFFIYSKLSNKLSKEGLFYAAIVPFIIFFGLFALVIYPNREFLHPHAFADTLQSTLPQGFMGLIALIRNWSFSLFYVMSELWGSVALSLLFWGFANDIMKVTEAKRFYSVLGLGANLALMVSGPLITYFSRVQSSLPPGVDPWEYSLNWLMGLVVLSGLTVVGIYYWMGKNVLTDPRFYNPSEVVKKKSKPKLSMKESFKYLFSSKYLACVAMLVIGYGISINIVEVTWKSQLKLQYPTPNEYAAFMGQFSYYTGFVTSLMMLFVGGNVVRMFGWGITAAVTPIVLLLTGSVFFSFVIFRDGFTPFIASLGTSPLMLAVIIGMVQNIMSKSCKYSLFDPTKEMSYIPLDPEMKVKGKAAIDVVGARLGKSGGALLQQGLILTLGSIAAMTPYVAVILIAIISLWLMAVRSLNSQFLSLTKDKADSREEPKPNQKEELPASAEKAEEQEPATTK